MASPNLIAPTKEKTPPVEPVAAARAAMQAAEADLRAAEAEMGTQDGLEHRLKREWSDHPTPQAAAPQFEAQIKAARDAYNTAYRAAEDARHRAAAAGQALRAAQARASQLPLVTARRGLERAQAAQANLLAEQAGLGAAQRKAAERGDVDDLAGVMARRDGLPHRLLAARMAVLAAQEQVCLGEADEFDASIPALCQAVEDTLPALEAAKAAHAAAQAKVGNARQDAADARRRAREAHSGHRQIVEDMSRDRGPVVRSMPHAGQVG